MIVRDTTLAWMRLFREAVGEHRDELIELDRVIGDGDHGVNLDRGMGTALQALEAEPPADPGAVLTTTAMALVSSVGGAAGPLYGTLLLQMGTALGNREAADLADFACAFRRGVDGVRARGRADAGDKTMLDALLPAAVALEAAGGDLGAALADAERAARTGMEATVALVARRGRASYLGERSAGHQDPGATSSYYLVRAARAALAG